MNLIVKKVSDKTKKKAKQAVKPVFEEIGEQIKSTPLDITQQIVGAKKDPKTSPIVEAMQSSSDGADIQDDVKKKDLKKFKKTREEMEADEKRAEQKRKELEDAARDIRDPKEEPEEQIVRPGEPLLPASKPSKGKAFVQQKQTKIESKLGKN